METWNQVYNPFGNAGVDDRGRGAGRHAAGADRLRQGQGAYRGLVALAVAIVVAIFVFTMPAGLAIRASLLGVVTGFFPIGWIILNVIFLYRLTVEKGWFETLQTTIGGVTRTGGCNCC